MFKTSEGGKGRALEEVEGMETGREWQMRGMVEKGEGGKSELSLLGTEGTPIATKVVLVVAIRF